MPVRPKVIRVGLDDRLLAEAIRIQEEAGTVPRDPALDALPRRITGDFEKRILLRAMSHRDAQKLRQALQQVRLAAAAVMVGMSVMAGIAGAATARAVLGAPAGEPVNIYWALIGALGVQCLALALWFILMLIRPAALSTGSLGGVIFALGRRVGKWLHKGPTGIAAAQAAAAVFARGPIGRWTLSAISHGIWMSFLIACLGMLLLMLSARQFRFAWETTILSDEAYVTLTGAIAAAPRALGFVGPDEAAIRASQWTGANDVGFEWSVAWSGLLVGSIVTYGIVPRLVLLFLCLVMRGRAMRRFRLDTSLPGYARLRNRLMPTTRTIGVIDGDEELRDEHAAEWRDSSRNRAIGPWAVLALEMELPGVWPPYVRGVQWLNMGNVETREDRQHILSRLEIEPHGRVLVVASLASTPDRGVQAFLETVRRASGREVRLLLSDGERLRQREAAARVEARINDWQSLARRVGLEDANVLELDLEHLTTTSKTVLAGFLDADAGDEHAAPARHLEAAFDIIAGHATRWGGPPDAVRQAELHRAIAKTYGDDATSMLSRLRLSMDVSGDLPKQLAGGMDRVLDLLPERLRLDPKWIAAGALSGVMACVAATTMLSPAAITALPMWAGLGAAVATALRARRGGSAAGKDDSKARAGDLAEAVAAAALFVMLLELQGRDETTITRVLDRAIGPKPPVMADVGAARAWLDELRHRFDMALAKESAP